MNNRNQMQNFHSVDIMQIAGKGNNNLLIDNDWYEYKRG